jgi:hypothetical protein
VGSYLTMEASFHWEGIRCRSRKIKIENVTIKKRVYGKRRKCTNEKTKNFIKSSVKKSADWNWKNPRMFTRDSFVEARGARFKSID